MKFFKLPSSIVDSYISNSMDTVAMRYLFNLVHFPNGEYPRKLTKREIICEKDLSEHIDCLSEEQRARIKLQRTILLTLSRKGKAARRNNGPELERE